MKFLFVLFCFAAVSVCNAEQAMPPGHPPMNGGNPMEMPAAQPQLTQKGEVVDVINVAQYTYLEVKQESQTRWIAGTSVLAKKGDSVQFDDGMEMKDFHSNTLNRTFPSIFFVSRIAVGK